MVNKQIIIGNLGAEPEVKDFNGNKACNFRVATTEPARTLADGRVVQERTTWHNVQAWGKKAELCGKYLHKGSLVYVEGIHHVSTYEKDGVTLDYHVIDAYDIRFLSPRKEGEVPTEQLMN